MGVKTGHELPLMCGGVNAGRRGPKGRSNVLSLWSRSGFANAVRMFSFSLELAKVFERRKKRKNFQGRAVQFWQLGVAKIRIRSFEVGVKKSKNGKKLGSQRGMGSPSILSVWGAQSTVGEKRAHGVGKCINALAPSRREIGRLPSAPKRKG